MHYIMPKATVDKLQRRLTETNPFNRPTLLLQLLVIAPIRRRWTSSLQRFTRELCIVPKKGDTAAARRDRRASILAEARSSMDSTLDGPVPGPPKSSPSKPSPPK